MTNKQLAKGGKTLRVGSYSRQMLMACGLLMATSFQSCEKDILTGQPEWLGNSIYERLEEGIVVDGKRQTFNYTIRLINELPNNQAEVLSHTGSRTIFVASDEDFEKWFKTNTWGVRSYDQLTLAQKKMLFYNSMINNAYLLELMSNVSGNPPHEGLCMRRTTTSSVLDTVFTMKPEQMPAANPLGKERLDAWARFRDQGRTIKIFKDNSSAPMIHFLPKFMSKNKITGDDLYRLTNGSSNSITDSWINGKKVVSSEQTCKNGYIYVVDGVVESSYNMAEIINSDPRMSRWASMLNRFSAPFYDAAGSREYNRLNGTNDSVYVLRYYSDWTSVGLLNKTPDDLYVPARLTFDPAWNQYMYKNTMGYDMHYDAGAMIVPTNEALDIWWNNAGKGLQKEYGSWENIPPLTLSKLLRVNMLPSFVDAVPSKFGNIVDDSKVTLGIKPENIVESFMGCNGVVYLVNQVFAPSEYRSVVYPALASQSLMGVIYYAIDNYDFGPYLNSMESEFAMILPYNVSKSINPLKTEEKYLQYVDPCTYDLPYQTLFEFYYDDEEQEVKADRYLVQFDENGNVTEYEEAQLPTAAMIKNRLSDLVDNLIIIGHLDANQKYYKTKAGSMIYVDYKDANHVTFYGGYQLETKRPSEVNEVYDMNVAGGNGISYGIKSNVPQTASKSVSEVLRTNDEFSLFYNLMQGDETTNSFLVSMIGTGTKYYCVNDETNKNIRLFDNYNYTVYVPTNAAIQKLIDNDQLPTWEDYLDADDRNDEVAKKYIAERIQNFLRYHIQDNSVYIGGEAVNGVRYETGKLNPENKRFFSLEVTASNSAMTVIDQINAEPRKVMTEGGLYNITCREYWMTKQGGTSKLINRMLMSSSNAVVHQINDVLLYDKEQLTNWKDELSRLSANK